METSYVSAQAFSGADLLHGPMAMIDTSVPTIAVVSPGRYGAAMAPVLERLAALHAPVLRVGASAGETGTWGEVSAAELPIATDGLPEHLLPIVEILPL